MTPATGIRPPLRARTTRLATLVACTIVAALGAAVAATPAEATSEGIKTMSRNLYLGADLTPLILAPTQEEFRQRATEVFQQVRRTDFPERAKTLADSIVETRPDVIGLQEVATWRRTPKGESDGDATPAKRVVFNFMGSLRDELRARGENYRVVERQREADIEGPTSRDYDVRLTQSDAILVRQDSDVRVRATRSENYDQNLVVPTVYGPVESTRGWTAADLHVGRNRNRVRFVNTHLEAFSSAIRTAQAEELTEIPGALDTRKQTVLVGDLNSDPEQSPDNAAAYEVFTQDGFSDVVLRTTNKPARTCCFNAEVDDPQRDFSSRIDHVLFRNGVVPESSRRTGIRQRERTASGLWPSDHAGVIGRLRVRDSARP